MQKIKQAYLYEFLGTAILTIARNLGGSLQYVLLIITWIAWDISGAHFNAAVTLGNFMYDRE